MENKTYDRRADLLSRFKKASALIEEAQSVIFLSKEEVQIYNLMTDLIKKISIQIELLEK